MVLRTIFKKFKVVSLETTLKRLQNSFATPFVTVFDKFQVTVFLEKVVSHFFEKYRPEIFRGLHKWCCERILRHLRLFRAKKFFQKFVRKIFPRLFLHISGSKISWKMTNFFFEKYWAWNFSWTSQQMVLRTNLNALKFVSSEHHFVQSTTNFRPVFSKK